MATMPTPHSSARPLLALLAGLLLASCGLPPPTGRSASVALPLPTARETLIGRALGPELAAHPA